MEINEVVQEMEDLANDIGLKMNVDKTKYMVRQFNSRNGPEKAKFAYLCANGCCHLRNTLLVKLCTS